MNVTPAQVSFSGGEIDPLLRERRDSDNYANSVAICRNMIPTAHGPAKTRYGSRVYDTILRAGRISPELNGNVLTWQIDSSQYVIFVVFPGRTYVFKRTSAGVAANTTPFFANVYASQMELQGVPDPNGLKFTIIHGTANYQPVEAIWSGTDVVTMANGVYTAQPWGVSPTFPVTGCIHQGRLWLFNKNNVWATKPGARNDFTVGTGTLSDSIINEIDDSTNAKWCASMNGLIVGTARTETLITSESKKVFTGDIGIDTHGEIGGYLTSSQLMYDKVVFVGVDSLRLFATQYSRDVQKWVATEYSFNATHILNDISTLSEPWGIISWTWRQSADYSAWFVAQRNIGADWLFNWASMTFSNMSGVMGWAKHDTQGDVGAIASGTVDGTGEIVLSTVRNNSNIPNTCWLEIANDLTTKLSNYGDNIPLDGYTIVDNTGAPTDTITGLGIYEGDTVSIIADGAVHKDLVVSGGQVVLDYDAELVFVGYSFTQELETLPQDNGAPGGSGRTYTKRFKDIYVGLRDSAMPLINGIRPPDRPVVAPMGSAPDPITELVKASNLGYSLDEPINIKQDKPQLLTVTGIFGEVRQDKL